jgi:hypothetical protein
MPHTLPDNIHASRHPPLSQLVLGCQLGLQARLLAVQGYVVQARAGQLLAEVAICSGARTQPAT